MLSDVPAVGTYAVAIGNPSVAFAVRGAPSRTASERHKLRDGAIASATYRLAVRAGDETFEWLRISAPVEGYVLFTLLDSYRQHVDQAARSRGSVLYLRAGTSKSASASSFKVLLDTPEAGAYILAIGNPKISFAIRGAPSRAASEVHELRDGAALPPPTICLFAPTKGKPTSGFALRPP